MALIDLEQAKEVVRDSCKRIPTMAIVTMQNLEKLPIIEPRVKGHWIDGFKRQRCSNCRYPGYKSWCFCPSCGADMREESDE